MKTYRISLTDCIHQDVAEQADDTRVLDLDDPDSDDFDSDSDDVEEEAPQEEAEIAPLDTLEEEIDVAPLTKEEKDVYDWPGIKPLVEKAKSARVIQTEEDQLIAQEAYDDLMEEMPEAASLGIDLEEFKLLISCASVMPKRSCSTLAAMRVWMMLDSGMRSANGDKKLIEALKFDSSLDFAYRAAIDAYVCIAQRHPFRLGKSVTLSDLHHTELRNDMKQRRIAEAKHGRVAKPKQRRSKAKRAEGLDAASSAADMCPALRSKIAHDVAEALKMKGFTKIDVDAYEAYGDSTVLADIICVKGTNTFKMEAVDTDEYSMRNALDIIGKAADRYAGFSNQTYKLSPYHE